MEGRLADRNGSGRVSLFRRHQGEDKGMSYRICWFLQCADGKIADHQPPGMLRIQGYYTDKQLVPEACSGIYGKGDRRVCFGPFAQQFGCWYLIAVEWQHDFLFHPFIVADAE